MDSRRITLTALTFYLGLAFLLAGVRGDSGPFPLATSGYNATNLYPALEWLARAALERRLTAGVTTPVILASAEVSTGNTTCQVQTIVDTTYTNCYPEYATVVYTNVVNVVTAPSAMDAVDAAIYTYASRFVDPGGHSNAATWFTTVTGTNWEWNSSSGMWFQCGYTYRTGFATYTAGAVGAGGFDAFPLTTSVILQADAGVDLGYISSITSNSYNQPGYEYGNLAEHDRVHFRVQTNYWEDTRLLVLPDYAMPSQGIEMVTFRYLPRPHTQVSVAFYPKQVEVRSTNASATSITGVYVYAGVVKDESLFFTNYSYVSYSPVGGGGYNLYLGNQAWPSEPFTFYQWGLLETPVLFGGVGYFSPGGDRISDYSRSTVLNPGYGQPSPFGSNLSLRIPAMEGTNWFMETSWVAVQGSALLTENLYIPYSNQTPPVWRATKGFTNVADFWPLDTTFTSHDLIRPSVITYTQVVAASRVTRTNVWAFDSAGALPAVYTSIPFRVNVRSEGGDPFLPEYYDVQTVSNSSSKVWASLDDPGATNYLGDAISLVWTQRTAFYGTIQPGSTYFWAPNYMNVNYPEVLNARWRVLDRLRFAQSRGFYRIRSYQDEDSVSPSSVCDDSDENVLPCAWPPALSSPAYSNNHTVSATIASSYNLDNDFYVWYSDETACESIYLVSEDIWEMRELDLMKGRAVFPFTKITNGWDYVSNGVRSASWYYRQADDECAGITGCVDPAYDPNGECDWLDASATGNKWTLIGAESGTLLYTNVGAVNYYMASSEFEALASVPDLPGTCATNREVSGFIGGTPTCGFTDPCPTPPNDFYALDGHSSVGRTVQAYGMGFVEWYFLY